jgi:hypothetical protein
MNLDVVSQVPESDVGGESGGVIGSKSCNECMKMAIDQLIHDSILGVQTVLLLPEYLSCEYVLKRG